MKISVKTVAKPAGFKPEIIVSPEKRWLPPKHTKADVVSDIAFHHINSSSKSFVSTLPRLKLQRISPGYR